MTDGPTESPAKGSLADEMTRLLNRFSAENESNTPDWILARFILACLSEFDEAVKARDAWYSVMLSPGNSRFLTEQELKDSE